MLCFLVVRLLTENSWASGSWAWCKYTSQWYTPDGRWQQFATRLQFHFVDESIDQIGVQANLAILQRSQPARAVRIV